MLEIIVILYAASIICGIWAVVRVLRYFFGADSDYVHVPWFIWVSLIIGIWIPFVSFVILTYILLICDSIDSLMRHRSSSIHNITASFIVESVERQILSDDLTQDDWVNSVWRKKSNDDWVDLLSLRPDILGLILDKNVKIHVANKKIYASWLKIVDQYIYMLDRENLSKESAV